MKRQLMKVRLTFHPSNTLTSANVLSASLHEGRTDSCIGAECWQWCQVLYQPVSALFGCVCFIKLAVFASSMGEMFQCRLLERCWAVTDITLNFDIPALLFHLCNSVCSGGNTHAGAVSKWQGWHLASHNVKTSQQIVSIWRQFSQGNKWSQPTHFSAGSKYVVKLTH